jgi:UDP-glucose 4-epimerase
MKTKKVLITGHKGYIGQHLWKLIEKTRPDIDLYGLDITDMGVGHGDIRVTKFYVDTDFHTVIHLAAKVQVGESVNKPTLYYDTNVNGTLNVLRNVQYHNFIMASTGAACNPDSPYGFSKRIAEDLVKEHAYDYTIFRFYNVMGSEGFPATNPDGLFYALCKAYNTTNEINLYGTDYNTKDGTCVREYVHVMDICAALVKAIDEPSKQIEHLAYGDTRTVKEIIDIFRNVNGKNIRVKDLPRRPGDLEACYLEHPSKYMVQNYTYEEMLKI